jgi:tetrahydromethanopterin S-methyltransferase subunit G
MKRDAAIAIAGIITFGKEAQPHIEKLSVDEQNELFLESAQEIAKKLGTSLDGLSVHRDESAVHAHFQMTGYGLDGSPLSKKIDIKMCSVLQDIGAKPFQKIGISRGERIGDRISRGDDYSKTIHRSVRELHSDLPKELEAAHKKVAEMENRVEKTESKLNQVRDQLAQEQSSKRDLKAKNEALEKDQVKLEKRLKTYEKRLDDRTAELKRLSQIGKSKPQAKTGTLVEMSSKSLFGKESIKSKEQIRYIPAEDIDLWFGGVVEKAKKARDAEKDALERANDAETRVERYEEVIKPLLLNTATTGNTTKNQMTRIAAKADFETYYSVIVQRTPEQVRVPPQKKSHKQIAAALYRSSRDNFDPKSIQFRVANDQIAEEIIRMAIEDDHVMNVSFQDVRHQVMLQEAAEIAMQKGLMGKKRVIENTVKKPSKALSELQEKPTRSKSDDNLNPE